VGSDRPFRNAAGGDAAGDGRDRARKLEQALKEAVARRPAPPSLLDINYKVLLHKLREAPHPAGLTDRTCVLPVRVDAGLGGTRTSIVARAARRFAWYRDGASMLRRAAALVA
jgi:hypothetical protein